MTETGEKTYAGMTFAEIREWSAKARLIRFPKSEGDEGLNHLAIAAPPLIAEIERLQGIEKMFDDFQRDMNAEVGRVSIQRDQAEAEVAKLTKAGMLNERGGKP